MSLNGVKAWHWHRLPVERRAERPTSQAPTLTIHSVASEEWGATIPYTPLHRMAFCRPCVQAFMELRSTLNTSPAPKPPLSVYQTTNAKHPSSSNSPFRSSHHPPILTQPSLSSNITPVPLPPGSA